MLLVINWGQLCPLQNEATDKSCYCQGKVRYLLGWVGGGGGGGVGGGLGLQRGASSMKFWTNGGGSRVLNLWKSGEGHAFRYRKHKLCKISNAFSAIQGAKISPGEHAPGPPYLPNASTFTLILYHLIRHAFLHSSHAHSLHCQFLTNLSQFGQDTLRTSWAWATSFKNIWSMPQHFLSELKSTEVRSLNNKNKGRRHNTWG